jgi:hypothetical protein
MPSQHREISFAIVIDTQDRFLFQQRDDVPGIIDSAAARRGGLPRPNLPD